MSSSWKIRISIQSPLRSSCKFRMSVLTNSRAEKNDEIMKLKVLVEHLRKEVADSYTTKETNRVREWILD
jgi:hypothetical protein